MGAGSAFTSGRASEGAHELLTTLTPPDSVFGRLTMALGVGEKDWFKAITAPAKVFALLRTNRMNGFVESLLTVVLSGVLQELGPGALGLLTWTEFAVSTPEAAVKSATDEATFLEPPAALALGLGASLSAFSFSAMAAAALILLLIQAISASA